jgi:hypothetical protein
MVVWTIHTYEDNTIKPMKHCLKEEEGEWKYNGEHEHVRSTLSACMEISQ